MSKSELTYFGKLDGESVYGYIDTYLDDNGVVHRKITYVKDYNKKKKSSKRIIYYCQHCNQEYIADKNFTGFIPKCINCGAIMTRKENK